MTSTNLAIVFSPNILRSQNETPSSALINGPTEVAIVTLIIESPSYFFDDEQTLYVI